MNCSIEVFIVFFDTDVDFLRFVKTKFTTSVQIWHVPEKWFQNQLFGTQCLQQWKPIHACQISKFQIFLKGWSTWEGEDVEVIPLPLKIWDTPSPGFFQPVCIYGIGKTFLKPTSYLSKSSLCSGWTLTTCFFRFEREDEEEEMVAPFLLHIRHLKVWNFKQIKYWLS